MTRPVTAIGTRSGPWLALVPYVARMELARRYAGSVLGSTWAVIFPLLQVGIYWLVFGLGLRLGRAGGVAFAPWLVAAMAPWFVFADGLVAITMCLVANGALVKRGLAPPQVLPLASLMASFAVHGVVLVAATGLLWWLGYSPAATFVLVVYYGACLALFTLSAGVLLALANAAFRDVSQLAASLLMIWFWATPVIWSPDILPPALRWLVGLNPMSYVVGGYRYALLGARVGAPSLSDALWFWAITGPLAVLALVAFQRFKRELADML
jgi:ABC-type polysaccharide/polyol phosphate export permease